MKLISDLTDKELQNEYVFITRRYNEAYKLKKQIEEEMFRRYEQELEAHNV